MYEFVTLTMPLGAYIPERDSLENPTLLEKRDKDEDQDKDEQEDVDEVGEGINRDTAIASVDWG